MVGCRRAEAVLESVLSDEEEPSIETLRARGRRLRELRKAAGLTQASLGEQLDISNGYISAIEKGDKRGSIDILVAWTTACGGRLEEVLAPDESPDRAARLRQLRAEAGLTQQQLADRLGLSDKTISAVENGRNAGSVSALIRWVEVCGGDPADIFSEGAPSPFQHVRGLSGRAAIVVDTVFRTVRVLEGERLDVFAQLVEQAAALAVPTEPALPVPPSPPPPLTPEEKLMDKIVAQVEEMDLSARRDLLRMARRFSGG